MLNHFIGLLVHKRVAWAAGFLLASSSSAYGEAAMVPAISGDADRNTAQFIMTWPKPVTFRATSRGHTLLLRFDQPIQPDIDALAHVLAPVARSASLLPDRKTIALDLRQRYVVRTSQEGMISAISINEIATPHANALNNEAAVMSQLAPAAGEGERQEKEPLTEASSIKVSVSAAVDNAVLRFPFEERMGLAAFIRGRYLWVVFHKKIPISIDDFKGLEGTVIGPPELLSTDNSTILRVPVQENISSSVVAEKDNHNIGIILAENPKAIASPFKPKLVTQTAAPAHVFIPVAESGPVVRIFDPVIGDSLLVIPTFTVGEGSALRRNFPEFSLLPSSQGVVVQEKATGIMIMAARNGLRVTTQAGAILSSDLPEPMDSTQDTVRTTTLFPYEKWKSATDATFAIELSVQLQNIIENKDLRKISDARLRIAELYLSRGLSAEALAQLEIIRKDNPSYYRAMKLSAMRGAANFIMNRFAESARDFAAVELNQNAEVDYWRAMLDDLLGKSDVSYDYMAMEPDYISKYPLMLRQRLAVLAADRNIAAKEYNAALKIFDKLKKDNVLDGVSHHVEFLQAKIALETSDDEQSSSIEEAFKILDALAIDHRHPFVRANAEYARIDWGLSRGKLSPEVAADRLERLRLSWHGDSLELNILKMLGQIYEDQKDYFNAMRIWHIGVTGFENTAVAVDMQRKMQEIFVYLFNEGLDGISPLNALALYNEYRDFMPTGNTGNLMTQRLADKLVALDLVKDATTLLDRLMRTQMEKEDRTRVGAKLAVVYLLNNQPQEAIKALQDSTYGETSQELRLFRNRLTAQAMIELGQLDRADVALGNDSSAEAERLRMQIFWQRRDWRRVVITGEQLLKLRTDITAPISLDESDVLMKLALAYVFEDNAVQLQYLRDYFSSLMENNPNRDMFQFITQPDVKVSTTNFEELLMHLSDTRSFLQGYRAKINLVGLDGLTPTDAASAQP